MFLGQLIDFCLVLWYHKDDGTFIAGFVDKAGKRHQRRFDTMVEVDRWLYEMRHQDEFGDGKYSEKLRRAVFQEYQVC